MRVLVTGGAGFIGSHTVAALLTAGHEVRVIDNLDARARPAGADAGLPAADELLVGDVRDPAAVDAAVPGTDVVVHLAAKVGLGKNFADTPDYVAANDLGTAVVLAAMERHGVGRLVLAGSMVVYGEGAYHCPEHGPVRPGPRAVADLEAGRFEPPCPVCGAALAPGTVGEDAPVDPRSVYAATKLAQEHLSSAWARATGGTATALRYHNVYGPGMPRDTPYAGVAALFRSALERGREPRVFEDGGQRRDFVHVRDVAAANVAAVGAGAAGELRAYNVGSGEVRTVGEMAQALAAVYGGPQPRLTGEFRLGDVRHICASSARIARELGWRASVPFGDGMREFALAPLR